MEGFKDRVIRHVKRGEFDPATTKRGLVSFLNIIRAHTLDPKTTRLSSSDTSFCGIEGLGLFRYQVDSCLPFIPPAHIDLVEFPPESSLRVYTTGYNDPTINTNTFLAGIENGISEFPGPTFLARPPFNKLPNNGFFYRNGTARLEVPFCDTNRSGQRRGAIAVSESGEISILADEQKWEIVRKDFAGYQALVGGSFYFSGTDRWDDLVRMKSRDYDNVSCLIQLNSEKGGRRLAFAMSRAEISFEIMKRVINLYAFGTESNYTAIELELRNLNCTIKDPQGSLVHLNPKGGFWGRRDHYVIER